MKIEFTRYTTMCITIVSLCLMPCCKQPDDPQPDENVLSVTPKSSLYFNADNNVADTLDVSTDADSWHYDTPDWVIAEKCENRLIVNVADNSGDMRQGVIAITAGNAPKVEIAVCQKAHRSIKQIVYIEVNDCNPLNILEYNLADGTPFFDAVILFAANINYDAASDRVYLHCNANVQALLDESDTYLQPLRERGIKVYLGILGNHDTAGVAQLSDWGAQQWAQEVAEVCRVYKLDGVNLDDEYSKAPDLENKWFAKPSAAAGARLAYELKDALAQKCSWHTEVSIFEYGALYRLPGVTVDGVKHTQSEFIDMVLANYGCEAYPYGDLTFSHCSGASIELNSGIKLYKSTAQNALKQGYGWCMWFAFNPSGSCGSRNNREHAMEQFNMAADVFYNTEMAQPSKVYNKVGEGVFDPQPYAIMEQE